MEKAEMEPKELKRVLDFYDIEKPEQKAVKLNGYADALRSARSWAGLTSGALEEDLALAVTDSLALAVCIEGPGGTRIADLGAGGGLLGIVLAIARPEYFVELIESSARKAAFLAETAGSLGLENLTVRNRRAEALTGEVSFDVVVSRAAGRLKDVAPLALGLLRHGGRYIALKAADAASELADAGAVLGQLDAEATVIEPQYPGWLSSERRLSLLIVSRRADS